ncbi:MAG TPA: hypothetical protein VNZ53_43780 [Steroidobacteraceae bacterium]|jgi:hypothetical protein|nr:hypothetical protein [Steroidobacteraceae bacterium]
MDPASPRWRSDGLSTEFGRGQFIFKLDDGAVSEKRSDGQAVGF